MENKGNQPKDGGKNLEGFEEFVFEVNQDGVDTQDDPNIEIDLGDTKDDKDSAETDDKDTSTTDTTDDTSSDKDDKVDETKGDEADDADSDKKATPKENQSNSYYASLTRKFIEKGKWDDAEVELPNGEIKKLSELDEEELNEDIFFQVDESQSKFKKEDLDTNYIKKDKFDENKLKIIQMLEEGADISDIFETPQEAQRPFEGADLEDERFQQNLFFTYLTREKGLNEEDSKVILKNHIERGELGDKVETIVKGYQTNYDNRLNQKLETIKAEKEAQRKKDKDFSNSLREIYSEYNVNTKEAKRLAELGIKRDKEGDFELDSLYAKKLEDPKEAAELIYFLTDKEAYLKERMSKSKIADKKQDFKQIKLIPSDSKKSGKASQEDRDDSLDDFIIPVPQAQK